MGNFRSDSRGGFRSGGRSGGFGGGRGGFRDRDERRRPEMHEAICDKCKKECQVPFKPTGDKPVFCSECFTKEGGSSRGSGSGISQEQFKQINVKLDKILKILDQVEFEEVEGDEELDESEEDNEEPDTSK